MSDAPQDGFRTSAPQVRNGAAGAENRIPHRTSNGVRGAVRNDEVRPSRCGSDIPQECRDHPGDIVVGRIWKSSREALKVRVRTIGSVGRVVMIRLCRQDKAGDWRPLNDTARCGITIRAGLLSETLDVLEKAEDAARR